MPIPLILDCDPGHDDAFAILLAAGDPEADLRAITTVGGNGSLPSVTDNALRVCTLAGLTGVPVAAGAAGPLTGALQTAEDVHGASGLDGPALPAPAFAADPRSAHDLLVDTLAAADEPVRIVATGPITNVAVLLDRAPELTPRIHSVTWMGGSAERGNRTPYAEFNAWVDPEALEIVLRSGVPFTLVGLHVTHQVLATPDVVARVAAIGTPLAAVCEAWLAYFGDTYRRIFGIEPPLHDPVALAIALDPGLARSVDAFVAVETDGRWTRGATVIDLDDRLGGTPNATVPLGIDVDRFWDRMTAAIAALPLARA